MHARHVNFHKRLLKALMTLTYNIDLTEKRDQQNSIQFSHDTHHPPLPR